MMMLSSIFGTMFPELNSDNNKGGGDDASSPIKTYTTLNPPHKDSGLQRLTPPFVALFTIMTAVYSAIYFCFKDVQGPILGIFVPAEEFCADRPADEVYCNRSDLFAFQVVSGLSFLVMGGYGFYCWHMARLQTARDIPQTAAGRCFSYIPQAEFLALVCCTFQVWDFFISLTIPEHATAIMLSHHIMAAAVSFSGMYAQYCIWFGYYYFGLSEVSSIFLVLLDLAKFFPPQGDDSSFAAFIAMYCGPMFALTFLAYRGVMWWYISGRLILDSYDIISSGQAEKVRPGKTWVLYVLSGISIPMGLLQVYWSFLILAEIKKVLMGENEA